MKFDFGGRFEMVKCGEWVFWEGREEESNPWEVALLLDLGGVSVTV